VGAVPQDVMLVNDNKDRCADQTPLGLKQVVRFSHRVPHPSATVRRFSSSLAFEPLIGYIETFANIETKLAAGNFWISHGPTQIRTDSRFCRWFVWAFPNKGAEIAQCK